MLQAHSGSFSSADSTACSAGETPETPVYPFRNLTREIGVDLDVRAPLAWRGSRGSILPPDTELHLRSYGDEQAPVIVVLGGISAGRKVAKCDQGWWSELVGEKHAIDHSEYRIIGFDFVAGDGQNPLDLTPRDQAELLAYALEQLGIEKLHAIVGSSFGGMVALSFARLFEQRVDRLIVLCAAHRPSPMAQARRLVQRRILSLAIDAERPEEGVALARSLAMTTYRTEQEFDQRFSCREQAHGGVEDYLDACGAAYAKQMSAATYLTLSGAIDHHFEEPERITVPTLIIGADSDKIVPLQDLEELHARLGGSSELITLSSSYGHDAFLKEAPAIAPLIRNFL